MRAMISRYPRALQCSFGIAAWILPCNDRFPDDPAPAGIFTPNAQCVRVSWNDDAIGMRRRTLVPIGPPSLDPPLSPPEIDRAIPTLPERPPGPCRRAPSGVVDARPRGRGSRLRRAEALRVQGGRPDRPGRRHVHRARPAVRLPGDAPDPGQSRTEPDVPQPGLERRHGRGAVAGGVRPARGRVPRAQGAHPCREADRR